MCELNPDAPDHAISHDTGTDDLGEGAWQRKAKPDRGVYIDAGRDLYKRPTSAEDRDTSGEWIGATQSLRRHVARNRGLAERDTPVSPDG